jgi:hypothetical protein
MDCSKLSEMIRVADRERNKPLYCPNWVRQAKPFWHPDTSGRRKQTLAACKRQREFQKMSKAFFATILVAASAVFGASCAWATINIDVQGIQKAVVFLYAANAAGEVDKLHPIGTGFLVGMPTKTDKSLSYRMLVTARHIVDPIWAKCPVSNPTKIFARVNKKVADDDHKSSIVEFIPVPLVENGENLWLHNADSEVDAAIVPIVVDDTSMDVTHLLVRDFPTDQEESAQSIGDPVMSAGLLPGVSGNLRNYPIFKFGQISNIPFESIETGCTQDPHAPRFKVKVWLIAANLVPGNSGSPIFHVPFGAQGISFGGPRAMILGIQSISFAGAGIAGMTPIKYVYEMMQAAPFWNNADLERGPSPQTPPTSPAPTGQPPIK